MRVLITRSSKDAPEFAQSLGEIGAEAIYFPTIIIGPLADTTRLDREMLRLQDYDWLVFTSGNAVDVVLERLDALGVEQLPGKLRVAAIGSKTAKRLVDGGIQPDFIPKEFVAEAILPGLGDLNERWVLLPVADLAHDHLPQAIHAANGFANVVTAYHTLPAEASPEGLHALRQGVDLITFTSGSTARNFVALLRQEGMDPFCLPGGPRIACIGPKTAQAAQEAGFRVDLVADTHSAAGLAQAIATHFPKNGSYDTI